MVEKVLAKEQSKVKSKQLKISGSSKTSRMMKLENTVLEDILVNLMMGMTLTKICSQPGFPSLSTLYKMMAKDEELNLKISTARTNGSQTKLDNATDMMLDLRTKPNITHQEVTLVNNLVTHARWEASKLIPNYNDKVINEHKGDVQYKIGWENDPILTQKKKLSTHTT
tara:strand:+ start:752 stop:1258 length:507 start_codon:yes stop_codon:yes gene_type:complete